MTQVRPTILIVGEVPPKPGGAAAVVGAICESPLLTLHYEFVLFDPTSRARFAKTGKDSIGWENVVRRLWVLVRLMVRVAIVRPALVHYHVFSDFSFLADALNIFALRMFGLKVICHYHNDPTSPYSIFPTGREKNWKNQFFVRTIRACDQFVFLGERFRRFAFEGFKVENVVVLHNCAYALPKAEGRPSVTRSRGLIALYLGRLSRLKGIFDFLALANICRQAGINIEFIVAGNPNTPQDRELVDEMVIRENLGSIRFLGVVRGEEKNELLATSDLLVFPSLYEGFPISILEAAMFGVPSIVYRIGMMDEIIVDGETGLIVDQGNVQALFENVRRLEGNRKGLAQMGANARAHVLRNFSYEKFETSTYAIYLNSTTR